jgi:hypothetical protein
MKEDEMKGGSSEMYTKIESENLKLRDQRRWENNIKTNIKKQVQSVWTAFI